MFVCPEQRHRTKANKLSELKKVHVQTAAAVALQLKNRELAAMSTEDSQCANPDAAAVTAEATVPECETDMELVGATP